MIRTKRKLSKTLTLICSLIISLTGYSQSMIVKGKVVDEKGVPLIGVTIIEKGINNGAATDFDGNYALDVQSSAATLVVSYIGFQTQIIPVSGKSTITA